MWSALEITQFIDARSDLVDPQAAREIKKRAEKAGGEDGLFLEQFLEEVMGDPALARAFHRACETDKIRSN